MGRVEYSRNEYAAQVLGSHYKRVPVAMVRSFGCQQSVNDGERMKGVLTDIGYTLTDKEEEADLILFNTCAVREHAEQRVFGNIGALKGLKAKKPGLLIGLSGCMAEEKETVDKIRKSYPYVDMVLGVNVADKLPELLVEKLTSGKRTLREPEGRQEVVEELPIQRDSDYKAFLPIMYGCNNFCTYCIVPYVRGRERSRKSEDILKEFRQLVAEGYSEITLLGQNVNSYGKGLEEGLDFSDLLALLCKTPGEYKVRFMTSHPKDATRKLIDTIAASDHICKHLHLPVQSGSDRLLCQMNRGYTVKNYTQLIDYAKAKCPEMTFSSDIIVGFPCETEEDFEGTLALVEKVGYTQLFTFIYSKRSGTKAAEYADPTPREEKVARMTRLLKLQEAQLEKVSEGWLGSVYTGMVDGEARTDGKLSARLDNNMIVEFTPDRAYRNGSFVTLKVTGRRGAILTGELV